MHTGKNNYHCYSQVQHHAKLHQYFLMPDTEKKISYEKPTSFIDLSITVHNIWHKAAILNSAVTDNYFLFLDAK